MNDIHEIAQMIDHSILHPTMTDEDLKTQCQLAKLYEVATVCVKPYHTREATLLLDGSPVGVCSVIGFPHGNSTVEVKEFETMQVIMDGASEVDMVINLGKALQQDWDYVSHEIATINNACEQHGAVLKVIFETDFLPDDKYKIKLCELASQHAVTFVKTSTGFGYRKDEQGNNFYHGATQHDVQLMRKHCDPKIRIKASGGIKTLDELLQFRDWGASRIGLSSTQVVMEEAKKRFNG